MASPQQLNNQQTFVNYRSPSHNQLNISQDTHFTHHVTHNQCMSHNMTQPKTIQTSMMQHMPQQPNTRFDMLQQPSTRLDMTQQQPNQQQHMTMNNTGPQPNIPQYMAQQPQNMAQHSNMMPHLTTAQQNIHFQYNQNYPMQFSQQNTANPVQQPMGEQKRDDGWELLEHDHHTENREEENPDKLISEQMEEAYKSLFQRLDEAEHHILTFRNKLKMLHDEKPIFENDKCERDRKITEIGRKLDDLNLYHNKKARVVELQLNEDMKCVQTKIEQANNMKASEKKALRCQHKWLEEKLHIVKNMLPTKPYEPKESDKNSTQQQQSSAYANMEHKQETTSTGNKQQDTSTTNRIAKEVDTNQKQVTNNSTPKLDSKPDKTVDVKKTRTVEPNQIIQLPEVREIEDNYKKCYFAEDIVAVKKVYSYHMDNLMKKNEELECSVKLIESNMKKLLEENRNLTDRLSTEMSDKLSNNESSLENVSIKNRPMTICEEYQSCATDEWLTVKEFLDEAFNETPERKKFHFLKNILLKSYTFAEKWKNNAFSHMEQSLMGIIGNMEVKPDIPSQVQANFFNSTGDIMRIMVDKADISQIMQEVVQTCNLNQKHFQVKEVEEYATKCARLCVKMVLQRPEMRFDEPDIGKPFNADLQDPQWGSANPSTRGVVVNYYVLPVMYHGDRMMVKGRVILGVPQQQ